MCVCAGWPRLLWFVTDGKHVVKPPKDWSPPIRDAGNETAYIEVRAEHTLSGEALTPTVSLSEQDRSVFLAEELLLLKENQSVHSLWV